MQILYIFSYESNVSFAVSGRDYTSKTCFRLAAFAIYLPPLANLIVGAPARPRIPYIFISLPVRSSLLGLIYGFILIRNLGETVEISWLCRLPAVRHKHVVAILDFESVRHKHVVAILDFESVRLVVFPVGYMFIMYSISKNFLAPTAIVLLFPWNPCNI